jgi:hypothetical protein
VRLELRVASTVVLERVATAVERKAVDLDDQPLPRPQRPCCVAARRATARSTGSTSHSSPIEAPV